MPLAQMGPERPPYIQFHDQPAEDRNATIAAGHLVMKSQHMVTVRQIGSKDGPEFIAEEWIRQQEEMAQRGRLPPEWASSYRKQYEAWQAGMEGPVNGFPIRDWSSVSRAMAENMIAVGVVSVEDLAAANEETLGRIGMGARTLQQKARAFCEMGENGASVERVVALKAENADLREQLKTVFERVAALEAKKAK